jgi:hypothetical protein
MDFLGTIEDDTVLLHGLQAAHLSLSRCPSPDGKTAAVSGALLSWPEFSENGAAWARTEHHCSTDPRVLLLKGT